MSGTDRSVSQEGPPTAASAEGSRQEGRPENEVTGEKIIEPVKARSRWLALERSDLSVRNLKREETAA